MLPALPRLRITKMTFFEAFMRALLVICGFALIFWIGVYVLGAIGLPIPPHVEPILLAVLVILCILILYRLFSPWLSGGPWWPRPPRTP
jgi:cytochrome c biogenesis protein CcdA